MRTGKLNAKRVKDIVAGRVPRAEDRVGRSRYHGDGGGLWLVEGPLGDDEKPLSASWIYRFMLDGKSREMGLGSCDDLGLADARELARQYRKRVRIDKVDPLDERRSRAAERRAAVEARRVEAAKEMTFRQCAERYIAAQSVAWKNQKHARQWPATLAAYAHPHFGDMPVESVDTGLVLKAVEPIWLTKPETASRVRGRIESVLDWATAREYREGPNPARWKGHLENLLPSRSKVAKVKHHEALPYRDVAVFIGELRQQEGIAARALEFAVLTAARTGETIGARWDEINLDERLWVVPGERMKAGKEHRVPLSDSAIAVLEKMRQIREGDFVFPGAKAGKPLSNMALLMLLRRIGHDELTTHGFRSTFADWAAERTNFPDEVRQMALAHTVSDKVEAAYRRGDLFQKRRNLMAAWARYCDAPSIGKGEVVSLHA